MEMPLVFNFVILLTLHYTTFHSHAIDLSRVLSRGQVCRTINGVTGICTHVRHCYGAQRSDKGNSHDCLRWHTCCPDHPPEPGESFYPEEPEEPFYPEEPASRSILFKNKKRRKSKSQDNSPRRQPDPAPPAPPPPAPPPPSSSSSSSTNDIPNLRVQGCGVRKILKDFIVGGIEAEHWPWMAAIFYRPPDTGTSVFQCGGTIISQTYILTAAHCLIEGRRPMPVSRVSVRVGGLTPQGNGRIHTVAEIKIPSEYRSQLHYDDIALLRLSQNIESKNVVPACLPSSGMFNANFYDRIGTVTGWGLVDSAGVSLSSRLREVKIPIVSPSRCARRYQRLSAFSLPNGIIDTQICAGSSNGSQDACQGDSGGPLLVEDQAGKWNVIGIVSFGFGCADPEYPGVYTRVAKYLPWLQQNTDIRPRNG